MPLRMPVRWSDRLRLLVRVTAVLLFVLCLAPGLDPCPYESTEGPLTARITYHLSATMHASLCLAAGIVCLCCIRHWERRRGGRDTAASRLGWDAAVASCLLAVAVLLPLVTWAVGPAHRRENRRKSAPFRATTRTLDVVEDALFDWYFDLPPKSQSPSPPIEAIEGLMVPYIKRRNQEQTRFRVELDEEGHVLDGWGRRLRFRRDVGVYSVGPNGLDESGQGDDIRGPRPPIFD